MANHDSAIKRAKQSLKRKARNASTRSAVHSASRAVLQSLNDPKAAEKVLSNAFSVIQKARGVLHRNAVRRKMAKLSKAVAQASKKA